MMTTKPSLKRLLWIALGVPLVLLSTSLAFAESSSEEDEAEEEAEPSVQLLPASNPQSSKDALQRRFFRWKDINSVAVNEVNGVLVYKGVPKFTQLSVNTSVDKTRLQERIDSFGLKADDPPNDEVLEKRGMESVNGKISELLRAKPSQPIMVGPSYPWLLRTGKEDLRELAVAIFREAQKKDYRDQRRMIGAFTSFVQDALPYKIPPKTQRDSSGAERDIAGLLPPIQAVSHGWGDCDSKSMVLAALVANLENQNMILLTSKDHMFVGIRMTPKKGDAYVRVQGVEYVLTEATVPLPLGLLPQEQREQLKRKEFKIRPLF